MTAVGDVQVFHLVEWVELGQVERDCPIPDRATDGEHLVGHHRRLLYRVARGLHGERGEIARRDQPPGVVILEAAHVHFIVRARAVGELLKFLAVAITLD
jgi:hypothetical protein